MDHQKIKSDHTLRLFVGEAAMVQEEEDRDRSRSREPTKMESSGIQKEIAVESVEDTVDLLNYMPDEFTELPRLKNIKQK